MKHAGECTGDAPIHVVMGDFHLAGINEEIIPDIVQTMSEFRPRTIAAGHCTGWRAVKVLANAFGDNVVNPLALGKRYTF